MRVSRQRTRLLLTALVGVLASLLVPAVAASPAAATTDPTRPAFSVQDLVRTAVGTADALTYTIRTTLATPSGDIVREHVGLVQVVLPLGLKLDLANRVDAGDADGSADIDADVWVNHFKLDQIEVDLRRVGGALPLRVELVLDLPDGRNGAAFGYDARDTFNPRRVLTVVTFRGSATTTFVDADATFTDAPSSLSVLAELFGRAGSLRFDPTSAEVALAPVPGALGVAFATDELNGTTVVNLTASVRTVADATLTDVKGDRTRTLDATIDRVPTSTTVVATSNPTAKTVDVDYSATEPIAVVDASATDTVVGGGDVSLSARAEQVPATFGLNAATTSAVVGGSPSETTVVTYGAGARLGLLDAALDLTGADGSTTAVTAALSDLPTSVVTTVQTIGTDDPATDVDERARTVDLALASQVGEPVVGGAEVGFASDTDVELLDPIPFFDDGELGAEEEAGYLFDNGGSAAARIAALRSAHLELGAPVLVGEEFQRPIDAHIKAGTQPFLVHQDVDGTRLDATILRLPADIHLDYDVEPNGDFVAGYAADGPIARSEVFLSTPGDEDVKPSTVDLHIDGIPSNLEVTKEGGRITATVLDDTGTLDVDRLERIEALVNGNPVPSPLPASDGSLEFRIATDKRLAADEEGVVLDVLDPQPDDEFEDTRKSVYARITNLTELEFVDEATLEAIDAPHDAESFREGSPMPIGDVPTIAAHSLTSTVGGRIVRLPEEGATLGPIGVRVFDNTEDKDTYLETRLETPPGSIDVAVITQHKRVDQGGRCDPDTGERCEEFFRPCRQPVARVCEEVFVLDYDSSATSGTLTVNTNAGDRENLFLTTPSLPTEVELCLATDGTCTDHAAGFAVTSLSMRVAASSELTDLELRDCTQDDPGDEKGPCGRNGVGLDDEAQFGDDDDQYLSGLLESVRFLEAEASPPPADEQPVGHVYVNTTGRRLVGDEATRRDPDPAGTHAVQALFKIRKLAVDPSCDDRESDGSLKRMRIRLDRVSADERVAPLLLSGGCTLVTGASVPDAGAGGTMDCGAGTEIDLAPNLDFVPAPPPIFFIDAGELSDEVCTNL